MSRNDFMKSRTKRLSRTSWVTNIFIANIRLFVEIACYLKSSCCSSFLSCFFSLYFASCRLTLLVESCMISKTVRPDDKIVIAYMNLRKIVFSIGLCERSRIFLDRKWQVYTRSTFLERVMAKPSIEFALDMVILCRYIAYWRLFWHFNNRILPRSYKTTWSMWHGIMPFLFHRACVANKRKIIR